MRDGTTKPTEGIGNQIVGAIALYKNDEPRGVAVSMRFDPGLGERFASEVDEALCAMDRYAAAEDLFGQLVTLGAMGLDTVPDSHTLAFKIISWLERRGHLKPDEYNGVLWFTDLGPADLSRSDEPKRRRSGERNGKTIGVEKVLRGLLVKHGAQYPRPLPNELVPFYCYTEEGGHCIICMPAQFPSSLDGPKVPLEDWVVPVPVRAVLRLGWKMEDGVPFVDVEYDEHTGVVVDDGDEEW